MEEVSTTTEISTNTSPISDNSAPNVVEAGQNAVIPAQSGDNSGNSPQISGESTLPAAYIPNYKVKAYDAEFEIPEGFRSFINEKNEKEFAQIFSKAYGLDVIKGKNEKLREQNTSLEKIVKEQYIPLNKGLDVANKYIANKDYGSLFDLLKIPVQDVQAWMLRELQMKDLPPEQQEIYTKNSSTQKQLYQFEQMAEQYRQELESMKEANAQAQVTQRASELDQILSRPDIKAVADRFDTRLNQAGAFRNEVIQRAQFIAQTKGQDISAEQAVADFAKMIMLDAPSGNPNNTVIPAKTGERNPTLPNLAGQTTSPAAQKIKSMADLQALKKQAIAQMNQNL